MILKNPEKLLKQWISAHDSDLWYVTDLNVTMDQYSTRYIYKLQTEAPVKSSPNQQYYHMTRRIDKEVTLMLNQQTYQLSTPETVWQGYCKDIDTMDKFIKQIENVLPKC
jgi:hypothetical protein